ncbi:MAG TPA: FAD-dependent oxidoreductase [Acidimicrobiales bacterium]|nr:FAD-dependent oxidoreductase [Acidimicrobiales bacterium]
MTSGMIDKTSRIAIVGAGPAGLSTAWFLAKAGFDNVTVLEKLGRVGGLCKSFTVDGMSYDLGANYVTWEYRETLAIAREVGATTYAEKPYTSIDLAPDRKSYRYRSLFEAVLDNASLFSFVLAAVRYLTIRSRLGDVIDIPNYLDRIHEHPELCVSFKDWLVAHRLMALATLFQFPITIMGYGELDEIAAPYALRYMSVRTFLPMVFGRPPVSWIVGNWPRRFNDGFQRLWERVAWRSDVRLNVNITQVTRSPEGICITMEYPEQHLNEVRSVELTEDYDYLVLACPLTPDVFRALGLSPNASERTISEALHVNPYCMTTFWVEGLEMPEPIAPVLPLPERGTPLAVARQFQDQGNMFTQFYTRPTSGQSDKDVIAAVKSLITILHGAIDESHARWHTFDVFTYFQHFTPDQIEKGIYSDLASMQGHDATFYVGGATDFELVEPIVVHSKYLVAKHFSGTTS